MRGQREPGRGATEDGFERVARAGPALAVAAGAIGLSPVQAEDFGGARALVRECAENGLAALPACQRPDDATVARFMVELATDEDAWTRWRGRTPVIVDASPSAP